MKDLLDRRLEELVLRRGLAAVVTWLAGAWVLAGALAVALVLLQRLALPGWAEVLPPALVLLALAPLIRLPRVWRAARRPPALLAAELDLRLEVHGLAMALSAETETDRDPAWRARLRRPLEELRWPDLDRRRPLLALLAILAVMAALLLPERSVEPTAGRPAWDAIFEPGERRLAELGRADLLPPERQEELEQRQAALKEQASREGMTQARWEALERLDRELAMAGEAAREKLAAALVQTEALRLALPAEREQAAAALAERLAELAAQAPGLVPVLPSGGERAALERILAQAANAGRLTPAQIEALRRRLGKSGQEGGGQLQIDPEALAGLAKTLGACLGQGTGVLEALGFGGMEDLLRQRGWGLDRGPGHAPLVFDQPAVSVEPGAEVGLPPGAVLNQDGSITLAVQQRDAGLDEAASASLVRARERCFGAGAADARRARVAPRHRTAVARYFGKDPAAAGEVPPPDDGAVP
jgi:hypothetical protein